MTRRRRSLVALVTAAVLLVACAPTGDTSWTPPEWSRADIAVVSSPAPLDVAGGSEFAASLTSYRVRNDAVGVQARFALLPGGSEHVAAFNAEIVRQVRGSIAAQEAATGVTYAPEAAPVGAGLADRDCIVGSTERSAADLLADPDLGPLGGSGAAVVCDILVAAGPILAQRLRGVIGTPAAVAADVSAVIYVDTASGDIAAPAELWAESAAEALSADIVEALRRDAGALALGASTAGDEVQLAAIRSALATTVPDGDGGLVFTIAAGFEAAELADLGLAATTEPLTVGVPGAVAELLVSPFGARVLASAGQPYAGPDAVAAGVEHVDCGLVPCVALTYDDGPTELTPRLLDELASARAPATFYMLGTSAAGRPDVVRRVAAEGHEIGNHTWNHPQLPKVDDAGVADQLMRTRDLLRSLSGQPVASFRPPYGEYSTRVLDIAAQPAILWTVDTRDWAGPADDVLRASAIDGAGPGGIVLFHDTHERSVRVAPAVIEGLRDRGFALVTVTQLFGGRLPDAGAWRRGP